MSASYRDLLTDLGISDRVVEEIQSLNEEYYWEASYNVRTSGDWGDYNIPAEAVDDSHDQMEAYLQSEGFIK